MSNSHLVVDGSNIATEGRTIPSLAQLDEAVRDFIGEHHFDNLVVVVDATFAHRIDASERALYEEAVLNGDLLTPPAGAVGRGDAFVLQIAERSGATVLSNDSFQEFHATYEWLFTEGRLWGGKPVPGVGWVFVPRVPVRGPVSRRATREAKASKAAAAAGSASETTSAKGPSKRSKGAKKSGSAKQPDTSAVAAKDTVAETKGRKGKASDDKVQAKSRSATRARPKSKAPINTPVTFLNFVTKYPLGSTVSATVTEFSSHGAYVDVDGARCYVSLKSMGDPAPRSAREVLAMGEVRPFVVRGFDTPRRGIDLALPGFEEFEADSASATDDPGHRVPGSDLAEDNNPTSPSGGPAEEAAVVAKKKAPAKKTVAKKAPAKATAKKAAAKKAAAKAPAKKTVAKKAPAKTTAKKTVAKKAPAKTTAKKAPAKKTVAKKAPAKKTVAKKAPAKTTAKKTVAKKAPAKTTAKKAPAKKTVAKKAPAKKTVAKKAPAKKG